MGSRIPKPTVFWGTACISEREHQPGQISSVDKESDALKPLSAGYTYQMPTAAGEGIVIYIIESTLKLGYSPQKLKDTSKRIKELVDDNKTYYSSKLLKAHLLTEAGVDDSIPLAGAEIDIEDNRLEVIWPVYKTKQNQYICAKFFDTAQSYGSLGEGFHGSIVANLAAGTSYGAAPKARVVLVNKLGSGPDAGGGIGLAYRAILEHYHALPNGTHAILNVSQGSTDISIQYNIDSLSSLNDLIVAGIMVVSAAGNRAPSTEMTRKGVDTFLAAVDGFPRNQYKPVRSVIESMRAIIKILPAIAEKAEETWQRQVTDLISGAAMSDAQNRNLESRVDEADKNTKADPSSKITKTELQEFKDNLRGAFVLADTVLPLISAIQDLAKTKLASKLEEKSLKDLQDNITAITAAIDSMKILYGPSTPKIPAAHPNVLSVGGLSTKYTICKEYYHGDAIDIYAPAQSIPFIDQLKSIHDAYETEKKKGPSDEGLPKKETLRLNGTSYASPIAAGAIACLLSQNIMHQPTLIDTSKVNHFGVDTGAWIDSIKAIARTHPEKNDKTPPQEETFKILCIAPDV